MTDQKSLYMWRGKLIDELSRDELIEALQFFARFWGEHQTDDARKARAFVMVEKFKQQMTLK